MKGSYSKKLAAAMTAGVLVASGEANAGNNFSNMTDNIVGSSSNLPNLISTVSYVGGIGFAVAGIMKLKQHVDNPGQVLMKDGLIRLGAGGGLLALPFMTEAMVGTISAGGGTGATAADVAFGAVTFP